MKFKITLHLTEEYIMEAPSKDFVTQNFYPNSKKIIGGDISGWTITEMKERVI